MKTLSTDLFTLEQVDGNLFDVFKHHYAMGIVTPYGQIMLHDDVIKGLEKKPHSGYWSDVVKQTVEQSGKLYEKYKI
nr:hypothetical protein [uncultured Haemophilus sp.]